MNKLVLKSCAKLNLYLEVLNKRNDAYHNIRTIFERINLSDKIILQRRPDKQIKILSNCANIPKDNSNLAFRSAKLLQDNLQIKQGVNIRIIKRIPVASGLGGGSSNAASVLLGLNRLWRLNLTQRQLIHFAKAIGSDVPFFIYNCPFAKAKARGDEIKPINRLKALRFWHILIVPKITVSTPKIYKNWDRLLELTRPEYNDNILTLALLKKDFAIISKALFNSLEQVTAKLYPGLTMIRNKLKQLGLQSILMSGSGPAMFGLVSSRKEALAIHRQLKKERSWQVFVTRTS